MGGVGAGLWEWGSRDVREQDRRGALCCGWVSESRLRWLHVAGRPALYCSSECQAGALARHMQLVCGAVELCSGPGCCSGSLGLIGMEAAGVDWA